MRGTGERSRVPSCLFLSVTECRNLVSVMGSFGGSGLPGTITSNGSGWEQESTQGAVGESEVGWMEVRRGPVGLRPAQTCRACCDSETSPSLLETNAFLTFLQALCSQGDGNVCNSQHIAVYCAAIQSVSWGSTAPRVEHEPSFEFVQTRWGRFLSRKKTCYIIGKGGKKSRGEKHLTNFRQKKP